MSEPQAAETTPLGTPVVPTTGEAEGSAPADFETFEARENAIAVHAEPTSKPEPVAPVAEAAPDKSVTAPKPDSRRTERRAQRDQDQINDTIRRAVQEATEATERRLRAELGKPAVDAPPAAAPTPIVDPKDPEPQVGDFEDAWAFTKAQAKWEIRQARREADAERVAAETAKRETAQRDDFHARATAWTGRRDTFIAANPTKAEALTDFLDTIYASTPIGDVIMESEVGAEVADYLAGNPTETERIARLAPLAALRALGKIEAKFDTTDTTTSASATTAGPAAKTVTSAPAPPTTLASRSATPADPAAAALARGDFEAWEAEENRKAIAAGR